MQAIRLDRRLAALNQGSRREVQELVRRGRVTVEGRAARDPGMPTRDGDAICLDGVRLDTRMTRHVMLNKPAGVLTAARDSRQSTVMDLLPGVYASLGCMPVGRLDRDTTGLLLLTTDGELSHRLLSPRRHVDKVYRAVTDLPLTEEDVKRFEQGLDLGDFTAQGALLVPEAPCVGRVTIHEGKFHQVKRMFEAVGKQVLDLDRLSFGPLETDPALERGQWRELEEDEVRALYEAAGWEMAT